MNNLEELRKEIDKIDEELIALFEKRMSIVKNVGLFKKENNISILNKDREESVIEKNCSYLKDEKLVPFTRNFLKALMEISREYQQNIINGNSDSDGNLCNNKSLKVAFLGISGSYSEQALYDYFGEDVITSPSDSFETVFIKLKNNEIHFGILPIENSSTGAISEVYDLLNEYNFYIVGEMYEKIEHCLLGINGSNIDDIKEVYSHPQGLKQCDKYLKKHKDWNLLSCGSTAQSAELIKNNDDKSKAAIGSRRSASLYGLKIIDKCINTSKSNTTRFVIVGKEIKVKEECDKISIVFSTANESGSLFNVLKNFTENNINLLKIESRPMKDRPWEYFFYLDFEGNMEEERIHKALSSIGENCHYLKIIGNYKKGEL